MNEFVCTLNVMHQLATYLDHRPRQDGRHDHREGRGADHTAPAGFRLQNTDGPGQWRPAGQNVHLDRVRCSDSTGMYTGSYM